MTDFMDDEVINTDYTADDDDFTLDLDMTGVERVSFEPAPEGDYTLKVEDIRLKKADTGNIGITSVFGIAEGEHAGKKIFHWNTVGGPAAKKSPEQTKKYTKTLLDAVTGHSVDGNISLNKEFFDEILGNTFQAHLKIQVQEGYSDKNVIGWFLFD